MHKDVFQELEWRGMIHNHIPGTSERLAEKPTYNKPVILLLPSLVVLLPW